MAVYHLGIEALLSFFDAYVEGSGGHAAALNALMGEELAQGLLCRCIEERSRGKARVLTVKGKVETPKPGTRHGKRLDCWIISDPPNEDRILYQVEIKNWNAHSYGGRYLSTSADSEKIKQHRIWLWGENWDDNLGQFKEEEARKVVLPMPPPTSFDDDTGAFRTHPPIPRERIRPLLSFWFPVHPEGLEEALFFKRFTPAPINGFPGVWVFSMSNYLRMKLASGAGEVSVQMPTLAQRIAWLNKMFSSSPVEAESTPVGSNEDSPNGSASDV
jgi:hypothetical protein